MLPKQKKIDHSILTVHNTLGYFKRILPAANTLWQTTGCEFSVVKLESHGILATTEEFLEITATYIEVVYGDYQLER
jgi:hypothetical protein